MTAAAVTLYPLARRTGIGIVWSGRDVSADLAPYLTGLTWSDSLGGKADDLQVTLHDRDGLWSGDWRPEFGDIVEASIEAESWVNGGALRRLAFGRCSVDERGPSGPPQVYSVKAISAGLSTGLRRTKRTRAWAGTSLRTIAQDIATRAGLDLLWSAPEFALRRQDQKHESDLAFLLRLCEDAGLACKVTDGQLAVFSEADLEAGTPVVTLSPGGPGVLSWSLSESTSDLYESCVVRYRDPLSGKLIEAWAGSTRREGGKTVGDEPILQSTRRVEDAAHAARLAEQLLAASQRAATTGSVTTVGDPVLVAGVIVAVDRAYGLDGRYIVTEAQHRAVGGYETALTLRRVLEAA